MAKIVEPAIDELLRAGVDACRIQATSDTGAANRESSVMMFSGEDSRRADEVATIYTNLDTEVLTVSLASAEIVK